MSPPGISGSEVHSCGKEISYPDFPEATVFGRFFFWCHIVAGEHLVSYAPLGSHNNARPDVYAKMIFSKKLDLHTRDFAKKLCSNFFVKDQRFLNSI